jgi:tetratricopeptide (TPR) repeat protein
MFTVYKQLAYDAQLVLAWMGQATGEYDTALDCLAQALLVSPNDSIVYGSMASLYLLKGELSKSEASMKQSISLMRPGNLDQQLYFLLKLYEKSNDKRQKLMLKDWFDEMIKEDSEVVSEEIVAKLKQT